MAKVFISYRRKDSQAITDRIYEHLVKAFGESIIFKDVDNILLGDDFADHIISILKESQIVLVIVGNYWTDISDSEGNSRLDDPSDLVRIEVKMALDQPHTRVIPVLVNTATMPSSNALPEALQPFVRQNATEVRNDPNFVNDIERLIRNLQTLGIKHKQPSIRRMIIIAIVLIGIFGSIFYVLNSGIIGTAQSDSWLTQTLPPYVNLIVAGVLFFIFTGTWAVIDHVKRFRSNRCIVANIPESKLEDLTNATSRLKFRRYTALSFAIVAGYSFFVQMEVPYFWIGLIALFFLDSSSKTVQLRKNIMDATPEIRDSIILKSKILEESTNIKPTGYDACLSQILVASKLADLDQITRYYNFIVRTRLPDQSLKDGLLIEDVPQKNVVNRGHILKQAGELCAYLESGATFVDMVEMADEFNQYLQTLAKRIISRETHLLTNEGEIAETLGILGDPGAAIFLEKLTKKITDFDDTDVTRKIQTSLQQLIG